MSLRGLVFEQDELADLDPAERRARLHDIVASEVPGPLVQGVVQELERDIDAYGPITELMANESVTDVIVNGPSEVWVDRGGGLERTDVAWHDEADLRRFIDRSIGTAGGRIDASEPIGDVRLPDGSRMHVVLPPVAPEGPCISIRRFPKIVRSLDQLEESRFATGSQSEHLRRLVEMRRSIVVSGATGSGKTTLLGALLAEVPRDERVVTIEETPELRSSGGHVVSLVVRHRNVEGAGEIDQEALLRAALRMRPDRIVVGEVRGGESRSALAAMSTGHRGSMVTVHARRLSVRQSAW